MKVLRRFCKEVNTKRHPKRIVVKKWQKKPAARWQIGRKYLVE